MYCVTVVILKMFRDMSKGGGRKWVSGGSEMRIQRQRKTEIQNYRPITILNIIYNIWEMVITERM